MDYLGKGEVLTNTDLDRNADLEPKTRHQTPMTCTYTKWAKVL